MKSTIEEIGFAGEAHDSVIALAPGGIAEMIRLTGVKIRLDQQPEDQPIDNQPLHR